MEDNNNSFKFELVSPEVILFSEEAWQVSIPGEEGHMGVRAMHASLVATLQPGVVEIWPEQGGGESKKVFIDGGFADVTAENCTVLAERAINVEEMDQATIEQEIQNLKEDLGRAGDDIERRRLEKSLTLAKAKLAAVTGRIAA